MAPVRRSATRAACPPARAAARRAARASPAQSAKPAKLDQRTHNKTASLSPVDSGYGSDGSLYSRAGTPPSSGASELSSARSCSPVALSASPVLKQENDLVKVKPWLSLAALVPESVPSSPLLADALAPPPSPSSPLLSPALGSLLAIFPDPVRSRLCIASYFSHQLSSPALSHEAFLAELDAPPTSGALDFGWLATLFAVVGCGAVALEERGAEGGVKALGTEWIAGAIQLWTLADAPSNPTLHALRAIVVLNGFWRNAPDGRYLRATVALNERVAAVYTATLSRGAFDSSSGAQVSHLLHALESSSSLIKLMLGGEFTCPALGPLSLTPTTGLPPPAEFVLRLHFASAADNSNAARVYASLLLDGWDASECQTPLPTDVALSYISGAFYLALDTLKNPLAPNSLMTRARLLAKVGHAKSSTSLVLQRGSELLGFVLRGEESVWEERRYGDLEAKVDELPSSPLFALEMDDLVKEEPADWTTFLNDV